jgi:exodeoxyribonuclease VII large subunit
VEITPQIYSVGQFLDLINLQLEDFPAAIQGEITSLSLRNHAYFSLTDANTEEPAMLNCALWQFRLKTLPFELKEGLEVQILGHANVYKPTGRFTFIVEQIAPVGEGALQKAFEELKRQLEAKGFFAPERKRPPPVFPARIGLLTSSTGDAIRDFKQHLGQFGLQIAHKDIRVEGLNAIPSIVEGIQWFNQHPTALPGGIEVLVLTRGGGSLESLQAFNSLEVAQAIFASKIPVVAAIGHERDVTIADLVADVRASTPTDAGRILSEAWRLAGERADHLGQTINQAFQQRLATYRDSVQANWEKILARSLAVTREFNYKAEQFFKLISLGFEHSLAIFGQRFNFLVDQINATNPQQRLKQGYSITTNVRGQVIKDASSVKRADQLEITLHQGSLKARVQ